jgi:hypothetical protein
MSDIHYTDTSDFLIQQVKNRETIPDSGAAYSDEVILDFLNQALNGYIVPALLTVMEEYLIITADIDFGTQPVYPDDPPVNVDNWFYLPPDCAGYRLRDIYVIGSGGQFYNLPRLTPTQAASQSIGNAWGPSLAPLNQQFTGGFYLQGNTVQIFPFGLASGKTVRVTYPQTLPDLCLLSQAGQVIAKNEDTGVLTLNNAGLGWHGYDEAGYEDSYTRICAISSYPPYDYVVDKSKDQVVYTSAPQIYRRGVKSYTGNLLTLSAGVAEEINLGDWICPVGKSVYALNIPRELYPCLTQKAAAMMLEASGDREGQQIAEASFKSMLAMAIALIAPRVEGKPIKLLPTNSSFRASRGSGMGRW